MTVSLSFLSHSLSLEHPCVFWKNKPIKCNLPLPKFASDYMKNKLKADMAMMLEGLGFGKEN